jgi:hypothetical protein
MTSVNGIREVVYVQPKERKGNAALEHVGNATVTAAGVGGTLALLNKGQQTARKLLHNDLLDVGGYLSPKDAGPRNFISKFATKIQRGFQSIGEKMFKTAKDNELISKMYGLSKKAVPYPTQLKAAKGKLAMGFAALATMIGFVTAGIYKAGKINGKNS